MLKWIVFDEHLKGTETMKNNQMLIKKKNKIDHRVMAYLFIINRNKYGWCVHCVDPDFLFKSCEFYSVFFLCNIFLGKCLLKVNGNATAALNDMHLNGGQSGFPWFLLSLCSDPIQRCHICYLHSSCFSRHQRNVNVSG